MKINLKELAEACYGGSTIEGRLHYKKSGSKAHNGFKEKWFKLRLNILFYFKLSETGTVVENKPSGCYILENSTATCMAQGETPFAFLLKFHDEKIVFSGGSDDQIRDWVTAINAASYGSLRSRLRTQKMELILLKGEEPFLPDSVSQVCGENSECKDKEDWKRKARQQSFRCYLPASPKTSRAVNKNLNFFENHFNDGKAAVEITCSRDKENGTFLSEQLIACKFDFKQNSFASMVTPGSTASDERRENVLPVNAAIPRPRPTRKAPDPPVPIRPPRGLKTNPSPIVHSGSSCDNLIDL